jgi:exopolysaccharide production protein ExoZ
LYRSIHILLIQPKSEKLPGRSRRRLASKSLAIPEQDIIIMQKLKSLEMVRAIAALLVVMYHTQTIFDARTGTTPFAGMFHSGFRGVDLFFVLSGFVIAHVHASDIGCFWRLGNYVFNRAARIYPAVWIMTLLASALYAIGFGGQDKVGKLTEWGVVAGVLLLPQVGDALVNVTWTLKYEVFFYLVFATLILNLRVGLALLGTWQLAVLATSICLSPQALGLGGFYLRSLCLEFSVGLGCALLIRRADFVAAMQVGAAQWVLLATGIAAFVGGMMAETYASSAGVLCALGAGAIIVGLILLEQSGRIRVPDVLVRLGGASYAIYLVHFSAITLFAVLLTHFHTLPMNEAVFVTGAAFGVAAGVAFDQAVDQPIQRLLRSRVKPVLFGVKRQALF